MKIKALIFIAIFSLSMMPLQSQAVSQDECAIWICLPAGFPSGCGGAKSAMKKRIKHHKSPLPSFSSCAVDAPGGSQSKMSHRMGREVWIPPVTCDSQNQFGWIRNCVPRPGYWQKGGSCPHIACKSRRYIDIFVDGQKAGDSFYW